MAYTFNIENTWGTVSLNSNPTETPGVPGCTVIDYPAKSAPVQDGTETVDEQFRILVQGTTQAQVNAIVGTIQRAFRVAEKYQEDGSGPRTFFTRSLGTMTATYRSEIVAADFGVSSFEYVGTNIYGGGMGYRTELSGNLTRRNWWEGAEAQLPLTNPNGTANITGLRVYNDNCGTGAGTALHYNWFDVPGTAIAGDLPAAYRAVYDYTASGSGANYVDIYVPVAKSKNQFSASLNSSHWVEAFAFGTATAVAGRTNGTVYRSGITTGGFFVSGTISGWGDYLATSETQSDYKFFSCLYLNAGGTLLSSSRFTNQYNVSQEKYIVLENVYRLYNYGFIPYRHDITYPGTGDPLFRIDISPSYGTVTVDIDFLSCVRADYYREIHIDRYAIGDLFDVVDDELDYKNIYHESAGTLFYKTNQNTIGQIRLDPNTYHRFYIFGGPNGTYQDAMTLASCDVKLYYRPRYLSL